MIVSGERASAHENLCDNDAERVDVHVRQKLDIRPHLRSFAVVDSDRCRLAVLRRSINFIDADRVTRYK